MGKYQSDPELIRACLSGRKSAWDELVDRYSKLVYSIPLDYGFSPSDSEDIAQNVFFTIFRKLDSLKDQTKLSAWLITITHRECWSFRRLRHVSYDETLDFPEEAPPNEKLRRWELQQDIREAMSRLDDTCRELLTALFLEQGNPAYAHIAARLGISPGSIGPTRARCFRKLEQILRKAGSHLLEEEKQPDL